MECLLGEGPLWDGDRLWWVDILNGHLHSTIPASGLVHTLTLPPPLGSVVMDRHGRPIVALSEGIFRLEDDNLARLAPHPRPGQRFNDARCDPAGRLWIGTMGEPGRAGLWMLDHEAQWHLRLDGVTVSNGLAWSQDLQTLYYIDSPLRSLSAFDYHHASGTISTRREILTLSPDMGYPDGMTMDEEGDLWIALYQGGAVIHVDPVRARIKGHIPLPVSQVSSCTFGGRMRDTLYITTARENLTSRQLEQEKYAGSLFRASPGISGLASTPFGLDV